MIDSAIVVAIIGAIATLVVGYWRFGRRTKETTTTILFTYRGRVSNIKNNEPIRGAEVEIQISGPALIVQTDSYGIFSLQLMMNGKKEGRIKVKADGYQGYDRFIELSPDSPELVKISLTPQDKHVMYCLER